jgi:hypothetical protein
MYDIYLSVGIELRLHSIGVTWHYDMAATPRGLNLQTLYFSLQCAFMGIMDLGLYSNNCLWKQTPVIIATFWAHGLKSPCHAVRRSWA